MVPQLSHSGLLLNERYQLGDLLEQGSLSAIYRGQDTVLRRPIVVKAVPPEQVAAYRNALHLTSSLTHPAIVATYDALEEDDWLFLIQEFVAARPLSMYLRNGIPSERALDLCAQLARALTYAHSRDVTHGDLAPTAILVDRRGVVRINNFALPPDIHYFAAISSTLPGVATEATSNTAHLLDDNALATPRDDVRAVGLLLWQFLSSPATYEPQAEQAAERMFRQDVPDEIRALTLRCLQPEHAHAIKDAESLTLALEMEAQALASTRPEVSESTPPALVAARDAVAHMAAWSTEETLGVIPGWANSERVSSGHSRRAEPLVATRQGEFANDIAVEERIGQPRIRLPSRPVDDPTPAIYQSLAAENYPIVWPEQKTRAGHTAQQGQTYPNVSGLTLQVVLLIGTALFLVAFLVGFLLLSLPGGH